MALTVELSLMRAEKLIGQPDLVDDLNGDDWGEMARLRSELEQLAGAEAPAASPLDRLSPDRRSFYEEMFSLIYECSANRSAAKSLVGRIVVDGCRWIIALM